MGFECFQRDDAKTADSPSFPGLFGVGVLIAFFFFCGCFFSFVFSLAT